MAMVMPNNPFRCPPGPYERACMIAHFLKSRKPKSKLVILDPKRAFSKQPVFVEAFDKYYKGIIELNLSTEIDDYSVVSVDPKTKEIVTKAGKRVRADVANIIPQQRAGEIAAKAGVNEGDWCPINPENFSSKKVQDIYVLGDAAIAAEMPKSAFSANSQAKVVAADIVAALAKKDKFEPRYRNTCWSLLAPRQREGRRQLRTEGRQARSFRLVCLPARRGRRRSQAELSGKHRLVHNITAEMFAKSTSAAASKKAG